VCLLYDGLTRCLPGNDVELAVAQKIDVSPDGTVYTFHLRNSTWNDGSPVTAYDFERSWKRALSEPSPCAYLFYPIVHAEAAVRKTKSLDDVGIQALNARTLQVRLEKPTPHFLSLTAFPSFLPVAETDAVNGPFVMQKTVPNGQIVLKKNPAFWNARNIHLDGMEFSVISDENTAWKLFEQGKLDWMGGALSPLPWETLASNQNIAWSPMAATTFCTFNAEDTLFSNEKIRQAFAMAIDREQIGREVLHGTQLVPKGCVPPGLWDEQVPETLPTHDPTLARKLFLEGCQEQNIDPTQPVHLSIRANHVDRLLAQILQWQWKEVLGAETVIHQTDTKALKELLHQRKYQVAISNWIAQYHDPMNILERFKSRTNVKNYPGWENAKFLSLVEQGFLREAEVILAKSCVIAPIYHWQMASIYNHRIKNMHTTSNGGVLFERTFIEE